MNTRHMALTLDENPAWYGLGRGVGHLVMTPVENPGGDHIGSGTLDKCCDGKALDADRAEEKSAGDRKCARCVAWMESDGYRDALAGALDAAYPVAPGESVADVIAGTPGAQIITLSGTAVVSGPVPGDVSDDTPGNTDRVTAALDAARKITVERENGARVTEVRENAPEVPAVREIPSAVGKLYAVESGGRWHVGDSPAVATARSEFYAVGEPGDTREAVVTVVYGKMSTVALAIGRGDYGGDVDAMRALLTRRGVDIPNVTPVKRREPVNRERARREAEAFVAEHKITRADAVRLASDKLTPGAQAAELRDAAEGVAAKRPKQARAWARITDGKCAVVLPATPEGDPERTVILSGRMLAETAAEVAALAGCGTVPVGKSAAAIAPVSGSDAAGITGTSGVKGKSGHTGGITGQCPVCHMIVSLTGSGGIGTHRPDGSTPDGPQLSQRVIPAVDRHGEDSRDAAKRREAESRREETHGEGDDAVTVMVSTAGDAKFGAERTGRKGIQGARNHGRTDGVAMVPRGESGYAGVRFDDGGSVDLDGKSVPSAGPLSEIDPVVGGRFGTKRESEYLAMSKSARRRYRAQVARNKAIWEAGRESRKVRRARQGMPLTSMVKTMTSDLAKREAEIRKRDRKARKPLPSGRYGNGGTSHLSTGHTDIMAVSVGSDRVRSGRAPM